MLWLFSALATADLSSFARGSQADLGVLLSIAIATSTGLFLIRSSTMPTFLGEIRYKAGVPTIEIERTGDKVTIAISCAKPGMVIGAKGAEVDKLKGEMEKLDCTLMVALAARDFRAAQTTAYHGLDALSTALHGSADNLLHSAAEGNTRRSPSPQTQRS